MQSEREKTKTTRSGCPSGSDLVVFVKRLSMVGDMASYLLSTCVFSSDATGTALSLGRIRLSRICLLYTSGGGIVLQMGVQRRQVRADADGHHGLVGVVSGTGGAAAGQQGQAEDAGQCEANGFLQSWSFHNISLLFATISLHNIP